MHITCRQKSKVNIIDPNSHANCFSDLTLILKPPSVSVIKSGIGNGTITSQPAVISCENDCGEVYTTTTGITLQVSLDEKLLFVGWTGDYIDCGKNNTCSITVDSAITCNVVILTGLTQEGNLVSLLGGG